MEFSLWLDVIGGGPDERPLANSANVQDIIDAVYETADEVDNDTEKYYELNTPEPNSWCYTFPTSDGILRQLEEYM